MTVLALVFIALAYALTREALPGPDATMFGHCAAALGVCVFVGGIRRAM